MKNITLSKISSLIGILLLASCASQDQLVPLRVLHWNDFHSRNVPYNVTARDSITQRDTTYQVGGSATLSGYINKFRMTDQPVLALNAGDDFQGTPISTITKGRSQIELLNIINPDAFVLGNHEFDYGTPSLSDHLKIATFSFLTANIFDFERGQTYVPPAKISKFRNIAVGIVGLSPPDLETLVVRDSLKNIRVLNTDSVANFHIKKFKSDGVDLIVVLSHMGYDHDVLLAQRFPQIDLIVGGHDHRVIPKPERVNRTLITQAGSWGRWLGKIDLIVDIKGDSIFSYEGSLVETRTSDIDPDPLAAQKVEELESAIRTLMAEVIGELKNPWKKPPRGLRTESTSGNWQADVIRAYAETDVAFQNVGGIRDDLSPGPITVGDVWRISPFSNHFVKFKVNGRQLLEMLEFQLAANMREMVQISGLRIIFDSSKPEGSKLLSATIKGNAIVPDAMYSIATNNYVASNLITHFGIDPKSVDLTNLQGIDRDVFIEAIRRAKIVNPTLDGRMKDMANEKRNP